MQFILLKSRKKISNQEKNHVKEIFGNNTSIIGDHIDYEWVSDDKKTLFFGRNPKIEIYNKYSVLDIDRKNNFSFIHGWVKKEDEDFLLNAKNIHNLNNFENLDGFFNFSKLNSNGKGEIYSSLHSPSIYYTTNEFSFALSNRILVLSELFNKNILNKKHIASHIQYQHLPITFDTLYEDIYQIPFGSTVKISEKLTIEKNYDFFYDEKLNKEFKKDSKKYWDDCFKKVSSQAKAFKNLGIKEFTLGISGGVDSRLLLSIYRKHVSSLFTWGPSFSPEVIVGRMISEKLNLPHETQYGGANADSRNLINFFSLQLFSTEYEMCPWDSGFLNPNISNEIKVDGQEYVKTPPYYEDIDFKGVMKIIEKEHSDRKFTIPDNYYKKVLTQNLEQCREYLMYHKELFKFAFLKKILSRGRWASRVHEIIFDHAFNIYPLLTNTMTKYAYNSSFESLKDQDIVYEMIKRSTPELLDVPLFNNSLKKHYVPPVYNKVPGKINYKYEYLIRYFEYLKEFMLNNYDLISDIVKKDFIKNLSKKQILSSESVSQSVYNILITIILLKYPKKDFWKKQLNYEFKIDDIKTVDDYDNNCITAFVEYNKDIVNLKIENNTLKKDLKTLAICNDFKINIPPSFKWDIHNSDENQIFLKSDMLDLTAFIKKSPIDNWYDQRKVGSNKGGFLLISKNNKKINNCEFKSAISKYENSYILDYYFNKFEESFRIHLIIYNKSDQTKFISKIENKFLEEIYKSIYLLNS